MGCRGDQCCKRGEPQCWGFRGYRSKRVSGGAEVSSWKWGAGVTSAVKGVNPSAGGAPSWLLEAGLWTVERTSVFSPVAAYCRLEDMLQSECIL